MKGILEDLKGLGRAGMSGLLFSIPAGIAVWAFAFGFNNVVVGLIAGAIVFIILCIAFPT